MPALRTERFRQLRCIRGGRYRRTRREKSLCGYPGCPIVTGDDSYYCREHAARHNRQRRERRAQGRAA